MQNSHLIFKPTILKRVLFFVIFDTLFSLLSFYISYLLRFNFHIPSLFMSSFFKLFTILLFSKLLFFWLLGIYKVPWRFFALKNIMALLNAHLYAYITFSVIFIVIYSGHMNIFPRSVIFIDFAVSLCILSMFRVSKRVYTENRIQKSDPTIIIGANAEAELIARHLMSQNGGYYPVAIADNEKQKIGTIIYGLRVYSIDKLSLLIKDELIESAIITKQFEPKELDELCEKLSHAGIKTIKKAHFLKDNTDIEDISIEDLLARKPKDLDKSAISRFVCGKKVLITGAGGSIGSEISRQCANYGASLIILVENGEYNLYKISDELSIYNISSRLIDVCDFDAFQSVFEQFRPEIVIHAAAYKHVPLAEENPYRCARNNILGTMNSVDLSIKFNAEKFVLISTDKAVRPTNIMGATKRVCELYVQNIKKVHKYSTTEVAAVRFGNVIGSSGSVIPKFKEQISKGGPITVTHPDIERYFMLIPEACELVLQAAAMAHGGEIFILDMGERVKIVDLANKMLELSGKLGEIKIEFCGLRPGEKLIEELLIDEKASDTKYPSIMIGKVSDYDINVLREQINNILDNQNDTAEILKEIVPEFNHNKLC